MTPPEPVPDALLELLERVRAANGAALVSEEELNRWPTGLCGSWKRRICSRKRVRRLPWCVRAASRNA